MSAHAPRFVVSCLVLVASLLCTVAAAQQDAVSSTSIKRVVGKNTTYTLPLPFDLDCPHHVTASSTDTNIFDVEYSDSFTKKPKVKLIPNNPGTATLTFSLLGKDQYLGQPGSCTGVFADTVDVRILPDDKDMTREARNITRPIYADLRQSMRQREKDFRLNIGSLVHDYKKGNNSLSLTLSEMNVEYFDAQIGNVLEVRDELGDASNQISNELIGRGFDPGFIGDHSTQGTWGVWDRFVGEVSKYQEKSAGRVDKLIWKGWDAVAKAVEDPAEVPEYSLVRVNYDLVSAFNIVPPHAGDWSSARARLPATVYYAIGYALECDPNSGAMVAIGYSYPGANIHGEFHIDGGQHDYDTTADGNGIWTATVGNFGSYGHGGDDGADGPVVVLPSGLGRYDAFDAADSFPGSSLFLTIP